MLHRLMLRPSLWSKAKQLQCLVGGKSNRLRTWRTTTTCAAAKEHKNVVRPILLSVDKVGDKWRDIVGLKVGESNVILSLDQRVKDLKSQVAWLNKSENGAVVEPAVCSPGGFLIADGVFIGDLLICKDTVSSPMGDKGDQLVAFRVGDISVEMLRKADYVRALEKQSVRCEPLLINLDKELGPLRSKKQELDAAAEKSVYFRGMAVGLYLIVQYTLLGIGVWGVYSWDVMEPICYFLGVSVTVAGAFYFSIMRRENSYRNLFERMRMKRRAALYDKHSFNLGRYEVLERLHRSISLNQASFQPTEHRTGMDICTTLPSK